MTDAWAKSDFRWSAHQDRLADIGAERLTLWRQGGDVCRIRFGDRLATKMVVRSSAISGETQPTGADKRAKAV